MAPEISKAVGHKAAPLDVTWNQRDLLLYVVSEPITGLHGTNDGDHRTDSNAQAGIGAKYDELDLTFELNENWKPFPTYPLVTGFSECSGISSTETGAGLETCVR